MSPENVAQASEINNSYQVLENLSINIGLVDLVQRAKVELRCPMHYVTQTGIRVGRRRTVSAIDIVLLWHYYYSGQRLYYYTRQLHSIGVLSLAKRLTNVDLVIFRIYGASTIQISIYASL